MNHGDSLLQHVITLSISEECNLATGAQEEQAVDARINHAVDGALERLKVERALLGQRDDNRGDNTVEVDSVMSDYLYSSVSINSKTICPSTPIVKNARKGRIKRPAEKRALISFGVFETRRYRAICQDRDGAAKEQRRETNGCSRPWGSRKPGRLALLDRLAAVHDDNAVGDIAHGLDVVADEDHGQTEFFFQVGQQIENLRTNRNVKCAGGLVGDQSRRASGKEHGQSQRADAGHRKAAREAHPARS